MKASLLRIEGGLSLVNARRIGNYYLWRREYVPATTLRGALINSLIEAGSIKELGEAASMAVAPAYPTSSAPAHVLLPAKGRKTEDFVEKKGVLSSSEDPVSSLDRKYGSQATPRVGTLVTLRGEEGDEWKFERFRPRRATVEQNVSVSKVSGAAHREMLFAYELRDLGPLWALYLGDLEVDGLEVRLGRGRNRVGTRFRVEATSTVEYPEPGEGSLAYCLSPCVPSFLGKTYFEGEYYGAVDLYSSWFTFGQDVDTPLLGGTRPSFKVLREGTLVRLRKLGEYRQLWPAGLNFLIRVDDLGSWLRKVGGEVK
ncbi:hypothetical protein HS1genome_1768 [Sulfodiicoccus acidiphilus]|uniref:Uncharacterized protein n=1 Tax=Sulfodiicoccus acidiphilus TaxID=1670455 RepID=A0A348B5C7_9CREN|nr:hypothetical protein [Sulfodiicoccus acidiphilus]BBD73379.1 hypothetical protein HS1genome_1768 [Sulfodiicoccus acidiphilus]GGU01013.1 hypothetical protein GCM10007116_17880 [Sulfodiicoccus acidiphilus]